MIVTLLLVLIAALSYALGCLNGSILVSRHMFGVDIRSMGSGNAGATNFFRSFGLRGLLEVLAVDIGKGVAATPLAQLLLAIAASAACGLLCLAAPEEADLAYYREVGRVFAAFCCIMGHVFPATFGFRGGKGILCGVSCVFVMEYHAGIICLLVFALIVGTTRYVSLGSVLAALTVPVTALAQSFAPLSMGLLCLAVALVVLKHWQNIIRLINHRETKIDFRPDVSHKLDSEDF